MDKDYARAMQELRRSSASQPHRNRKRHSKADRAQSKRDLKNTPREDH